MKQKFLLRVVCNNVGNTAQKQPSILHYKVLLIQGVLVFPIRKALGESSPFSTKVVPQLDYAIKTTQSSPKESLVREVPGPRVIFTQSGDTVANQHLKELWSPQIRTTCTMHKEPINALECWKKVGIYSKAHSKNQGSYCLIPRLPKELGAKIFMDRNCGLKVHDRPSLVCQWSL